MEFIVTNMLGYNDHIDELWLEKNIFIIPQSELRDYPVTNATYLIIFTRQC